MKTSLRMITLGFVSWLFVATPLAALASEEEINTKPLKTRVEALKWSPNQPTPLTVQLDLAEPYKAYLDQFKLKSKHPDVKVGTPQIAPVITFMDPFSKIEKQGMKGQGQLLVDLIFAKNEIPSPLLLELTYQACTDKHCLFPTKIEVVVPLVSGSAAGEIKPSAALPQNSDGGLLNLQSAMEKGWLFTLGFVFLAGILTSLTPCIFPMIPITLSIIGASQIRHGPGSDTAQKRNSPWRGFSLSVMYVLGIALTYALLGVTAAKTGALFGSLLSNIWVVAAISLLFVVMGLSMYGLFEIQMPSFVRNRLGSAKTDPGFAGAFIAGLISGIVASPCVGPVLVAILTYVARTQDSLLGFLLLWTYAIGMGLLLVAVGTFSSLSQKLPRSGPWMDFVKFVFGTAMIGMALFYVHPILPQSLFYIIFGLTGVALGSFFGAFESNEKLHSGLARLRKGSMVTVFVVGVMYTVRGLFFETPFVLPSAKLETRESTSSEVSDKGSQWKAFDQIEFEQAMLAGRPIVVDFWAEWCAACKELEKFTFNDPQVQSKLKDFVLFKANMTIETSDTAKWKDQFKIMGLPTIHFFNGGNRRDDLVLTGFEDRAAFLRRLDKVLKSSNP